MDDILRPLQDAFEGQIIISFLTGYIYKDIHLTLWTGLAGTLFTALVVVPPWPFYNRHPEKWVGGLATRTTGSHGVVVDGVKVA
ncbi:Microsomal signal peptidase Spc12 [Penicillium diatomitis]|uniref:Signal peptidase complex subunit 1 n=1 Tax=Penicillium diatomitis TaxID=2819901 RepID=A0A9W9WKH5_9EURO|nr:Microsomal signal peptidase Spc12 [Penicillium diatomitis]KAJ5466728.1 Microsomal signal peptidase Spc12 [Penicillium diatomitis]